MHGVKDVIKYAYPHMYGVGPCVGRHATHYFFHCTNLGTLCTYRPRLYKQGSTPLLKPESAPVLDYHCSRHV